MTKRIQYHRFIWFHTQVKNRKFPNAKHLVEKFEISERTAYRDIDFMRNTLDAPLAYNQDSMDSNILMNFLSFLGL